MRCVSRPPRPPYLPVDHCWPSEPVPGSQTEKAVVSTGRAGRLERSEGHLEGWKRRSLSQWSQERRDQAEGVFLSLCNIQRAVSTHP